MVSLIMIVSMSCIAQYAEASPKPAKKNPTICGLVAKTLIRKPDGPPPLYVDSINGGGRGSIYQNVDIDADQIPDSVQQDCGSVSDGTCTLYVNLSGGGGYEVSEDFFSVRKFQKKYYILVGDTYPDTNIHRRLYLLKANGTQLICKSF